MTGYEAFVKDMKDSGIHVGIGGVCAVCEVPWPCPTEASQPERPISTLEDGWLD